MDQSELEVPFGAMALAEHHRGAGALLSASWALYQATHWPFELQLTDRMLYLQTAVAALCEDPDTPTNRRMYARWRAVRSRFGLIEELRGFGLVEAELETAERRLGDVRNVAAHGPDSVLVNLGYPSGGLRRFGKRERRGEELALAQLYSELRPLQWMIRGVLQRMWRAMVAAEFDDEAFESQFRRP